MTQLSVMELAKQGDPHAIAALINRSLSSKGIHAEAELEAECLKISLQASQIPNQKAVIAIIHRGMAVLQVSQIKRVKVLTYRSDNNYLAWQHEIILDPNLDDNLEQSLPTPQIAKSADLEQDRHMNLVNSQKGVILVQKLSQIQQNLQEYQDIIVRFTDEQVGTVRCLTTLTELIQVISKPSFLFAAVASNPNLRSLLDTIAESSKTDENGDQVITNLSILQPGQQWQKAKIRLVTKIFLEPAQDRDNPESNHQGLTLDLAEASPEPLADRDLAISETYQDDLEDAVVNLGLQANVKPNLGEINEQIAYESSNKESLLNENSLFDEAQSAKTLLISPQIDDEIESLESITADSLFDEFSESSSNTEKVIKIVDDATEISDASDSLFGDFIVIGSSNGHDEPSSFDKESVYQDDTYEDENTNKNINEDLFGNFAFEGRSPDPNFVNRDDINLAVTDLETNIESIKSRIPKQSLDKLLLLINEEEQKKNASQVEKNKDISRDVSTQLDSDFGSTTIERILGNMETIALNGVESTSSSDLITLEDFLQDIDSVGF